MVRKKKVTFNEEAKHLGWGQESGEWVTSEEDAEEEKLSGEFDEWMKTQIRAAMIRIVSA